MKLDLSNRPGVHEDEPQAFEPGDIAQGKTNKLYLVISSTETMIKYISLAADGSWMHAGQVYIYYANNNWRRIGHCEFGVSQIEWF